MFSRWPTAVASCTAVTNKKYKTGIDKRDSNTEAYFVVILRFLDLLRPTRDLDEAKVQYLSFHTNEVRC